MCSSKELARLRSEVKRLSRLVQPAYAEGYLDGLSEMAAETGGWVRRPAIGPGWVASDSRINLHKHDTERTR